MDVTAEPLAQLRRRTSEKWSLFPEDVLPLFVAEMDYPLAPAITETLIDRVRASDTGYVAGPGPLAPAFAGFAERHWSWQVDPAGVRTTTDVSVAIVETLRMAIRPGDGVVITPPVYPPFFDLPVEAGGTIVEVPLLESSTLDLEGLERAFAGGSRAFLLCNPHNPLGTVHSREVLERVASLAAAYGVTVVSDEIHGPLSYAGVEFTPFLSVSDAAREYGVCVTSASKAFNLAGLKCAIMVAASERSLALLDGMTEEVGFRTGILGLHSSVAAFAEGDEWLAGAVRSIEESGMLLRTLLAEHLPGVLLRAPAASYLAWLDFRTLGWGADPSVRALAAGVALNAGPSFGAQGVGHTRLNFACSPEVLTEAVRRLARA